MSTHRRSRIEPQELQTVSANLGRGNPSRCPAVNVQNRNAVREDGEVSVQLPTRCRIRSLLQSRWQMTLTSWLPGVPPVPQTPTILGQWSKVSQEVEAGLGSRGPYRRNDDPFVGKQGGEPLEGSDGPPCTFLSCGPQQAWRQRVAPLAVVTSGVSRRRGASKCDSKGRMGVTSTRHAFVEHQQ